MSAPAAHGAISDLTTWDFYRDPDPGAGALQDAMTGSAAPNLAQLNFINSVPVPPAYDIGFSSVNANTVGEATSGYYFSASQDFTVSMNFSLTLTNLNGLVGLGFGIGQDRAGVNSAGIGFVAGIDGRLALYSYVAAARNDDNSLKQPINLIVDPDTQFAGLFTVSYEALTGDVTVAITPSTPPVYNYTYKFFGATDLPNWTDDDLLVSFFLRSDINTLPPISPWSGESAEADFFDFTVVEGTPITVPEPTSLAIFSLGLLGISRRRRRGA